MRAEEENWGHLVRVAGPVGVALRERLHRIRKGIPVSPPPGGYPTEFEEILKEISEEAHGEAVQLTVHEYARQCREFFSRGFRSRKDLLHGQGKKKESVLPAGLGYSPSSKGRAWTPDGLIDHGRAALEAQGVTAPHVRHKIAAGLHAAAVIHPAKYTKARPKQFARVRAALFNSPALLPTGVAQTRLAAAYTAFESAYSARCRGKRGSEPADAFRAWHSGGHSNVPKSATTAVRNITGCTTEEARAAVVELCWRSFRFAGAAVSAAMSVWLSEAKKCEKLTDKELALFRVMYIGTPQTAGLPLAVLHDRRDLFEPWLTAFTRRPRTPRWGVLYTLFGYYAAMTSDRRTADKAAKQRKPLGPKKGRTGGRAVKPPATTTRDGVARRGTITKGDVEVPVRDRDSAALEAIDATEKLAERVRTSHGLTCGCANPAWSHEYTQGPTQIDYAFHCGGCGEKRRVRVDMNVLAQIGTGLLG